jgi:predicted nucleic acid-binding protein
MGLIFDTSVLIADERGKFDDLQIAATALALGHEVATLNVREFQRVAGLRVLGATPFWRP